MKGQYTLFGMAPEKIRKPSEYAFDRYIGQKVRDRHGEHIIADIEVYYTIFTDRTVGTPHDLQPVDDKEYDAMLDKEIEYWEYLLNNSKDYDMYSIWENNLRISKEEKRKLHGRITESK